jgi:hypothetical protein
VALDLLHERGVPLERQQFNWQDLVRPPISKLNDDAFTRVRIILMNGIESEALRFQHAAARFNGPLRLELARLRRAEQHQQTLVNWLLPADQSLLETTIAYEQVAIEVTAHVAMNEPDPYLAQVHRFGMLEDFDHLYRFAALMDRLNGQDANNILQCYTDVIAGRPTSVEHRAPEDDLRRPYDRGSAEPLSKLHALTILSGENQTHDYYMTIGPTFADPLARQLYAEIASIEEQHVTQYESIIDPEETLLEKWLLRECTEVFNYWSCHEQETNSQMKQIWARFLDYELGHLHHVMELMRRHEGRDPEALLPAQLDAPIAYESHRQFVRETLASEVDLRARGSAFIRAAEEGRDSASARYRATLNANGSPSEIVAAGYRYRPGTELAERAGEIAREAQEVQP